MSAISCRLSGSFLARRVVQLARVYPPLQSGGTEVIAIALPGATTSPSLPFPVVAEGSQEEATAYKLFPAYMERSRGRP